MPIKGVIFIVIFAIVLGVVGRDHICEWLEYRPEDDDIDNNYYSKED